MTNFYQRLASLLLIVFLLTLLPAALHAQRIRESLGTYISRSEVIALADAQPFGDNGYETLLTFREILKGDPALVGKTAIRPLPMSSESVYVPKDAKGILVLLDSDWRKPGQDALIEAYQKPADIALLRALIPIFALPNEKERIIALRDHVNDADPRWQEELFASLREMRDPANYSLVTELFPALDPVGQRKVVSLIGEIGDPRGLPTVFQAVHSPDRWVRNEALRVMQFQFPGFPGVAEAMRALMPDPDLQPSAAAYLLRYFPHEARLKVIVEKQKTPFSRAEALWEAGKKEESKRYYLQVIEDKNASEYTPWRSAGLRLVPMANGALKDRVRPLLLPLLAKSAAADYIQAEEAAKLLRALHHPDCLPPLLTLLEPRVNDYGHSHQIATQAIRELGPQARKQAAAHLLEKIQGRGAPPNTGVSTEDAEDLYFRELAWIGDAKAYQEAHRVMAAHSQPTWEIYRPLVGVAQSPNEGDFLLHLIQQHTQWPDAARNWMIARLGELHEKRAVPALLEALVAQRWSGSDAAQEALSAIGGPEVAQGALKLLARSDSLGLRQPALAILASQPPGTLLPVLRRMRQDDSAAVRSDALAYLARYGTPEDLKTLIPMADFWTGDRANHYWAMNAVTEIRDRHHYDVTGLIKTASRDPGLQKYGEMPTITAWSLHKTCLLSFGFCLRSPALSCTGNSALTASYAGMTGSMSTRTRI